MRLTLLIAFATLSTLISLLAPTTAHAQETRGIITRGIVVDGDTIPYVVMNDINVFARRKYKSKRQQIKWTRFIYNVKKALPYARMISRELNIIDDSLAHIPTEKDRKAFIDAKEKELFSKYEEPLKKLTVSQGRILIKLVDRETGHTSYELIQLLKGKFKAFWWQGIARVFGSNLKSEYDPEGDDKAIEDVVLLIDLGIY